MHSTFCMCSGLPEHVQEDDPVFRDASDALDSLRLGPHTGAGGRAGADSGGSATSSSSGSDDGEGAALHVDPDALSSSPGMSPFPAAQILPIINNEIYCCF